MRGSRSRSRSRDRNDHHHHHHHRSSGGGGGDHRDSNSRDHYHNRGGDHSYRDNSGRDHHHSRGDHHNSNSNNNRGRNKHDDVGPPSATVVMKGLPTTCTVSSLTSALGSSFTPASVRVPVSERDPSASKGFAFIEFYSIDDAQSFMKAYAGSATGALNAPEFIYDRKPTTLQYSRDESRGGGFAQGKGKDDRSKKDYSREPEPPKQPKMDWICENCQGQNFSRRVECYRCSAPKTERSIMITAGINNDMFIDSLCVSETPSTFLAVRHLGPFAVEDQVTEIFRQLAVVKSVFLLRDPAKNMSRGVAFVEFHSLEHAQHALNTANSIGLQYDNNTLKVSFAHEGYMRQSMKQYEEAMQQQAHEQQLAAVAMQVQAAQWGMQMQQMPSMMPAAARNVHLPQASSRAKPSWPPPFESHGSAFVFQPNSGYFFEPLSEFYYCPKSKLYYNSSDGVYYRYVQGTEQPFVKFIPPIPTEPNVAVSNEPKDDKALSIDSDAMRKPVVISLGLSTTTKVKAKATVFPGGKKVLNDIAKWGAVNDDDDAEEETIPVSKVKTTPSAVLNSKHVKVAAISTDSDTTRKRSNTETETQETQPASNANSNVKTICHICKRGFASIEQLTRHEKESKLHAENVAKQAAAVKSAPVPEPAPVVYRDRASERRAAFGLDHTREPPSDTPAHLRHLDAPRQTVTSHYYQNDPLPLSSDTSNPGNRLLRNMGWEDGKGLGQSGQGIQDVIKVADARKKGDTFGVGSTDFPRGSNYKESLYNAAKARYDQIEKNNK